MKKPLFVLLLLICIIGAIAQVPHPMLPEAKVTVRVIDQDGKPVQGASVGVGFEFNTGSGTKSDEKHGPSDKDGLFSASGKTSGYVAYAATKQGYYRTEGEPFRSFTKEDGKWQPYNPTLDVVLKRIIKPIPMYARMVETDLPLADEPIGYDLVEADWVAPHGRGKVGDFVFKLTKRVVSYKDYGAELQITFLNKQDGIQGFNAPPKKGSELRSPHQAPEQGYEPSMSLRQGSSEQGSYGFNKEDQNYLFRVRTVVDEKGKIVSALYGKVYGQLRYFPVDHKTAKLRFVYYLNPAINDRNVEFDPARNLFTGLGSAGEVMLP
jgi:hypothetical protein